MDDEHKSILVCGVYLGDISLALAALAAELPSYVQGVDIARLVPDDEEAREVRAVVEAELGHDPDPRNLPEKLVRAILERGVAKGRFMSARRCVDILGEKDTWVERHISRGRDLVARGDAAGAAKAFVIAANLDAEGGIPAYQYLGPALHDACTAAPEKCITRLERESALRAALKYLLASEKVHAATADLPVETLAGLLAGVVLERDPHAGDFYAAYCKAHAELEEVKAGPLKDLAATLRRVASELGRLARDLQAVTSKDAGTATAIERAKRTAGGLGKDFEGLDDLLGSWQIRRIRHRVERLVESAEEFSEIRDALGGSGSDGAEQVSALLALAGKVSDEHLKERVEDIERRLLSAQATMLGRQVHSQEHWQYLRELAFKCPVSPLMCCVQRINDTWMVAPVWDGELAAALRQHLENLTRPEQTPIP